MRREIATAAAVVAMAFGSAGVAAAAPCTVGTCVINDGSGGEVQPLNFGNSIGIQDENVPVNIGQTLPYFAAGEFEVVSGIPSIIGIADISFSQIIPPFSSVATGFANFTIEFFQEGMSLGSFQITDAAGVTLTNSFMFDILSDSVISFEIVADVFRNFGAALPDYNINLYPVPLPGALPLLLAGLAGLGFAMRRKRPVRLG